MRPERNSRIDVFESVIYLFIVTCSVSMALRSFVRKAIVRSFGLDDWFIAISTVLFEMWMCICLLSAHYGFGRRRDTVTDDNASNAFLMYWLAYFDYGVVMSLTRVSVGLFFLRITVNNYHRAIVWGNIGINLIAGVGFFGVVVFQCAPVDYFWKKVYPDAQGTCINYLIFTRLGYCYSAMCAFCDIVFVILPFLLVWNLDMSWRKKIGLIPILGMAGFTGACPLVRIKFLPTLQSDDTLFDTVDLVVWSIIEAGLAITATNLATLRPLFRYVETRFGKLRHTNQTTASYLSKRSRHSIPAEFDRHIDLTPKNLRSNNNLHNPDDHHSEEIPFSSLSPDTLVDDGRDDCIQAAIGNPSWRSSTTKPVSWRSSSKEGLPRVHERPESDRADSPDIDPEAQWPSWAGRRSAAAHAM